MADSRAGWYPDPSGDQSKLRYWDGDRWTDDYADSPAYAAGSQPQDPSCAEQQYAYTQEIVTGREQYRVDSQDQTLRLIAFVFCILSTVGCGILIVPLAWQIPMSVVCWGIYKGTRPNTVAFGVCTLLFVNMVAGILLLVSKKDA